MKVAKLEKPFANRIVGHGEEDPEQLLANPFNARLHPDHQQQALAGAIDEVGYIRSVTVNRLSGHVVDGHLRVTLALRSGVKSLPVEYVELTDDEEKLALLTLDPITSMAAADKDKLEELLHSVQSDDERVSQMLTELAVQEGLAYGDEPKDVESQFDRAAELLEKWGVEYGSLWKIADHRLLCGDATVRADVERVMGGERAGAVVTDPPYNVGVEYGAGVNDRKTLEENETFIKQWFGNMPKDTLKVITPGAGYYLNTLRSWLSIFPPTWLCIWIRKNSMSHSPLRGFQAWEPLLFYKNELTDIDSEWGGVLVYGKVKKPVGQDVFDIPVRVQKEVADENGNKYHPTPKPLELFLVLVNKFTQRDDIILDPFAGSGTTGIAAHNLGRKARMIEIEPKYIAVCLERFGQAFPGIQIERMA